MSLRSWWKRTFGKPRSETPERSVASHELPDLREFVYLDEVSLRSLLSSQKGGVTDSTSEQATEGREASLSATAGVDAAFLAKAEATSRFQTSNSSTIQTSRKATVQSWFREVYEIDGLRFIEPVEPTGSVEDLHGLAAIRNPALVSPASELRRGRLVEMRVRLAADPVFHLGTMVSEFTAMAEDYPDMFAAGNALATLHEVKPINKILQRLLAGLVPVRALAIDYVVAEVDGVESVVHKSLLDGLELESRPLEVVGVTEHEAYWKDLRRVLFSEAEFTVLARISRPGLYDSWTPVKLADLFRELTPGLVEQINAASRTSFSGVATATRDSPAEVKLATALTTYVSAVLTELGRTLDEGQAGTIALHIAELQGRAATVSGQRSAFAAIDHDLMQQIGVKLEPARALELRNSARDLSGLPLFPALTGGSTSSSPVAGNSQEETEHRRLLDVDVIAIYW